MVTVFVPTKPGVVTALSRPLPSIWKLWIEALSMTTSVYMPALSVLTTLPFCFSEMVKPGPTVPISFGGAIEDDVPTASSPTAAATTSVHVSFISVLRRFLGGGLRDRERPLHRGEMRVADVLVGALDELDDHGLRPDEPDRGDLPVHATGAAEVEVVDVRLVRHD